MSRTIDNYYTLYNNPFLLSEIIVEFYKSYNSHQRNDLLLSYIVLPLTLYEISMSGLQRANSQRSIRSFVKEAERLYGLSERISEYRHTTNMAIQFSVDQHIFVINSDLSVIVEPKNIKKSDTSLKQHLAAATNLAKMVNGIEIVSVYRQLGIKQI